MKRLVPIFVFLFWQASTNAQLTHNIKEVIVEGKAERNAIYEQKNAGLSTLVISNKELNNFGHSTAGDILKRLPRIVVQGPPSFNRNIMIAGLNKEFQTLLINGNRPAGGEDYRDFKLDRIPVSMIEKIEITFNPPASMGADATVGAVNIILKETPAEQTVSGGIAINKSSTINKINPKIDLAYGNKWGKWSFFGNYNLNIFERQNINHLKDSVISGTEVEDVKVNINGITVSAAFEPDSTQKWKFTSYFTHYNEDLYFVADVKRRSKGGLNFQADTALDLKHRIIHSHTLSYIKSKKGWTWDTEFSFAQNFDNKERNRKAKKSETAEISLEDEKQQNSEIILKSDFKIATNFLNFNHQIRSGVRFSGLNRDYDRLVYSKIEDHKFWDSIEDGSYILKEYRSSLYIADKATFGKFWIYPALRFDTDFNQYSTNDKNGKENYFSFNPSFHTKYFLNKNLFLKADIAKQNARPPFNFLVPVDKIKNKKQIIERGNPELVPSKAINVGLGAEKYFSENGFVALRGFYSRIKDIIESREIGIDENFGYRIFQPVNIDTAKVWGIDVNTHFDIIKRKSGKLSFNGNVSRLGSEVRDPGTFQLRPLNEQPKWIANGSVDYLNTKYRFQFSLGVNYVGKRFISATVDDGNFINKLEQAPFMQVDTRLKYFLASYGSIYLNVVNLFDETMDFTQGSVSESEVIGRNILLGINLNF